METETLKYISPETLVRTFNVIYEPLGWKIKSPIEKKWSWKYFGYIYQLVIEREEPKEYIERINNKNELNTNKYIFKFNNRKGDLYVKEFFYDPNVKTADLLFQEFNEWKQKINP